MLKPQDVLVALRLATAPEGDRTFPRLAAALDMSSSEVHAAVKRAVSSGLVDGATRTVRKSALLEFLVHGLRYVFPAEWRGVSRGFPTSYAAPPLRDRFPVTDLPPVWPHPEGTSRGEALVPITDLRRMLRFDTRSSTSGWPSSTRSDPDGRVNGRWRPTSFNAGLPDEIPIPVLVVARHLGELRDRVVFVGGMVRSLLVTDPAAGRARPTDDVDLIVDVPSTPAYYEFQRSLRDQRFREAYEEGAPLCRMIVNHVRVDVMPVDPAILGFSNVWYVGAHAAAIRIESDDGTILILDGPHFCATKLEAFLSRGDGDLYHHDLEDFIAIVDGRPTLLDELRAAPADLRDFVVRETATLLAREAFVEALPGHLDPDEASQNRLPLVLKRLRAIAALMAIRSETVAPPTLASSPTPLVPPSGNTPRRGPAASPNPRGGLRPSISPPVGSELDHVFTRSSNLHAASYDAASSTLVIQFRNGSQYAYSSVPPTIYSGLLGAASAGRYHHQWIRLRYAYRRLR